MNAPLLKQVMSFQIYKRNWTTLGVAVAVMILYGVNATLMYDDLYLIEYFRELMGLGNGHAIFHTLAQHRIKALECIFFNLDLGVREYRLYGLSRLIHCGLSSIFGANAWAYGAIMGASQLAAAWMIRRLLQGFGADKFQSSAVAGAWLFSPFAVTFCFHHYSYLILPFQLTLVCALLVQKILLKGMGEKECDIGWMRVVIVGLGLAIAWTGELHLILAAFVLAVAAFLTPSARTISSRCIEFIIPNLAIGIGIILHRGIWSLLVVRNQEEAYSPWADHTQAVAPRFILAGQSFSAFIERSRLFLASLSEGWLVQVRPVLAQMDLLTMLFLLLIAAAAFLVACKYYKRMEKDALRKIPVSRSFLVPLILFLSMVASLIVVYALVVLTGQVGAFLPRRYGYVPYSLALMFFISVLSEARVRHRVTIFPALAFGLAIIGFWGTLQMVCLPKVREQDRKLWARVEAATRSKVDPCILILNAWNHPDRPGFELGAGTPAMRGLEFPEIFESQWSAYWWASQYAHLVKEVHFVGYKAEVGKSGLVRLYGNGLLSAPYVDVPGSSLVVITDTSILPPACRADLRRAKVIDWDQFKNSPVWLGSSIEKGLINQLRSAGRALAVIDLGDLEHFKI